MNEEMMLQLASPLHNIHTTITTITLPDGSTKVVSTQPPVVDITKPWEPEKQAQVDAGLVVFDKQKAEFWAWFDKCEKINVTQAKHWERLWTAGKAEVHELPPPVAKPDVGNNAGNNSPQQSSSIGSVPGNAATKGAQKTGKKPKPMLKKDFMQWHDQYVALDAELALYYKYAWEKKKVWDQAQLPPIPGKDRRLGWPRGTPFEPLPGNAQDLNDVSLCAEYFEKLINPWDEEVAQWWREKHIQHKLAPKDYPILPDLESRDRSWSLLQDYRRSRQYGVVFQDKIEQLAKDNWAGLAQKQAQNALVDEILARRRRDAGTAPPERSDTPQELQAEQGGNNVGNNANNDKNSGKTSDQSGNESTNDDGRAAQMEADEGPPKKKSRSSNSRGGNRGGNRGGDRGGTRGGNRGGDRGSTRGGNRGGDRGGTRGGTRGAARGNTRASTRGNTRGSTSGGTRGGSRGGKQPRSQIASQFTTVVGGKATEGGPTARKTLPGQPARRSAEVVGAAARRRRAQPGGKKCW
jgi:hypothetical protein